MSGEDFLAGMAASSARRVAIARERIPEAQLMQRALASARPPALQLSAAGFDVIAELKLRSPALGALDAGAPDVEARIAGYAEHGAAAVSVLTEPDRCDGALEHLERAVRVLKGRVPAMRKDFLVDAYQVTEARVAGAGGVLVILRMLARPALEALLQRAAELELFVLLEAFDERDIALGAELVDRHRAALPLLLGVNCRDLVTLQVVPGRLEALAARLPDTVPRVAESGVDTPQAAAQLAQAGYQLALIGGALMKAADPAQLLGAILAAGRSACAGRDASCG
jgi:indole-3-glycerol phosphate synthase